jgi:hypothetical protein
MQVGIYTFAELGDAGPAVRMRELLEEAELAEQVGLDVFGAASTTGRTSSSRHLPWHSQRSPHAPVAFA